MKDKEKNDKFQEPISDYQVNENSEVDVEEMNPILIELIEKSKQQHKEDLSFSHEEAMKMIREKYDFLK
jgi:hypothetical protein